MTIFLPDAAIVRLETHAGMLCDEFAQGPNYSLNPSDVVYLNGIKVPGIGWVDVRPGRLFDVKKPHGGDGARAIEKGWECRPVVVTVKYWTRDQEQLLWELVDQIWSPPGKPPSVDHTTTSAVKTKPAVTVEHPNCARLHVDAMQIQEIQSPVQAPEGPGVWLLRIVGLQYFEPKAGTERKMKGAGHTLIPKGQGIKNAVNVDPAKTEGVPKKGPTPSSGST